MGVIISCITSILGNLFKKKEDEKGKFEIGDGITLFDSGLSPACHRVRILLAEKGIPYKKVPVNLVSGEQFSEDFMKINPNKRIPALALRGVQDIPDCVLTESSVINEFLDKKFPEPQLFPDDPWELAQVKMWQDWELGFEDDSLPVVSYNMIGFMQRLLVGSKERLLDRIGPDVPDTIRERNLKIFDGTFKTKEEVAQHALSMYKMLTVVEKALGDKDYIVGGKLTAADVTVYSRLHMMHVMMLPIPVEKFPNVARYRDRLAKRKSFEYGDSKAAVFSRMFRCMPGLVVSISNWRTGQAHQMLDGRTIIDKAISESEEETADKNEFARLETGLRDTDIVLFDYPSAIECWEMKLLLCETERSYREVECDILDLIGRPAGSGGRFRLQHGEKLITGARTVLEYIDELSEDKGLLPHDPLLRAKVQCWLAWDHNMYIGEMADVVEMLVVSKMLIKRFKRDVDSLLSLRSNPKYSDKFQRIMSCYINGPGLSGDNLEALKEDYGHLALAKEEKERLINDCKTCLVKRLNHLDEELKERKYLVGDELTLADLVVWCRLQLFEHIGLDISSKIYPSVYKWLLILKARKYFWRISEKMEKVYRCF